MSELGPEVQRRSDVLAALDNGSAAIGKGLAIGSAALTALALFSAYQSVAGIRSVDVGDPYVMAGMLFGAMLPFLFGAMVLRAVGGAASEMVEEVRRQFRSLPGPVEDRARADCTRCVDTAAAAAIRRLLVPGIMAVVTPVAVGLLDEHALGGMLAGVIVSGVPLAIFMGNAGGAWRNGGTYIEGGQFGGTGSDAQTAVAAGDTVGDPFKDAVGPSLNTLIKLMSVVALVLASLLA